MNKVCNIITTLTAMQFNILDSLISTKNFNASYGMNDEITQMCV